MLHSRKTNYYIGETAFHHEGDVDFLKKLIKELGNLKIQAIKFHLLFNVSDYMVPDHSATKVLEKISISQEEWEGIFKEVVKCDKDIIALTNDLDSLKYINKVQKKYPIEAIELHSTGLNDLFLLKECLSFQKTIILGVGGSSFDEVKFAIDFLRENGKEEILLMHGFQNYPTSYEDINFNRIKFFREAFNLPIGYADHTDPSDKYNSMMSVLPAMLGVKVFEKHITNVVGEKRIDAQAAIGLEAMQDVIDKGNAIGDTLGNEMMQFSEAELNYGNTGPMKKALVARKKLELGTIIKLKDLAYKRTEDSSSIDQKDVIKLIGSEVKEDIQENELISFAKVNYNFKKQSTNQFFIKE